MMIPILLLIAHINVFSKAYIFFAVDLLNFTRINIRLFFKYQTIKEKRFIIKNKKLIKNFIAEVIKRKKSGKIFQGLTQKTKILPTWE